MNPICKQCGQREVEDARVCYATPVCFACLPPPLPLNTAWSLSAVWMADMADVLEHVRHEDGGPKLLTPDVLLGLVNELREDRDHWKLRAERAEYALPSTPGALVIETPYQCRVCGGTGRNPMSDNANWLPCAACMARQRGMVVGP